MSASETAREKAQQTLLEAYAKLLARATHMHELAKAELWAELIEQRTQYVMLVEELRELDTHVELDTSGRKGKSDLLESILEHDVEIRRCLVARRDELGKLISVSQRQRDLYRAYAPQQGNNEMFNMNGSSDEGAT